MNKILSYLFALGLIVFGSCSKDTPKDTINLSVTPQSNTVSASAGFCVFQLSQSLTDIIATSNQDWCTAEIKDKEIVVFFTENDLAATRTAILTITKNDSKVVLATIAVIQSRATISLADDQKTVYLKAAAEPVTVAVNCELDWQAHSKADWLTLTPQDGKLIILPTQNISNEARRADITLSVKDIAQFSFNVEQEGVIFNMDLQSVKLYSISNNRTFDIVCNIPWTASSNASWLTATNDEGKLRLTTTANDGDTRTTEVSLIAGNVKKKIDVSQYSFYESIIGTWNINGLAIIKKDDVPTLENITYTVSLLEKVKDASFLVDGFGKGYLASSTYAPFTLDFDAAQSSVSITLGEEIGTFIFDGFIEDPEGKADVKSVFLQLIETEDGNAQVQTSLDGGEVIMGEISDDLNSILFENNKGMGYGMWVHETNTWSGYFCSYRMFNIQLTRDISNGSSTSSCPKNQFFMPEINY